MGGMRRFLLRLYRLLRFQSAERELDRELASHVTLLQDEFRRRGLSADEAHTAATRALGGIEQTKEAHRDERSFRWLEDLWKDTGFAARSLMHAPGFAAVVILTLALGIGGNTAIFSVVNAVLLRSLPYPGADRFVRISRQFELEDGSGTKTVPDGVSLEELELLRSRAHSISNLGTYIPEAVTLTGRDEAVRVNGVRISPPVMAMLGAAPLMGRLFESREERAGLDRVAIVSYSLWQRRLDGDKGVLGQALRLNDTQYTVVGVMRPGFHFPDVDTEFWVPFVWPARGGPVAVARVKEGVLFQAAGNEVTKLLRRARANRHIGADGPFAPGSPLPPPPRSPSSAGPAPPPPPPPAGPPPPPAPPGSSAGPNTARPPPSTAGVARNIAPLNHRHVVVSLKNDLVADATGPLTILWCAVGFVLLIACVNVGGLLLARGIRREREIWVRLALGAGRARVVRQLLTEGLVLASLGGIAGVWLAVTGVYWLRTLGAALPRQDLPSSPVLPRLDEIGVDGTVLMFAVGLSVAAGLTCSLMPALWQTRVEARGELARNAGSSGHGLSIFRRSRAQASLVILQIGLAVVLLLGAGLMIRSFLKLSTIRPGYETVRVLTFQVPLPPNQSALELSAELLPRLQGLPGVRAAGVADHLPLTRSSLGVVQIRTEPGPLTVAPPPPPPPGTAGQAGFPTGHIVSHDFLEAMGIAIIAGRGFADHDARGQSRALLINRTLARSGFLGEHPLGARIYTGNGIGWDVIGIVEDVRQVGLTEPPGHQIYASLERWGRADTLFGNSSPYFAVRTDGPPAALMPAIREIVRKIDPRAAPDRIASMDDILSNSILRPRFYTAMIGLFAVTAGALAIVGISAGIAFAVSRRMREIGIRMALGATKRQILVTVIGEGLVLAGVGIAAGLAGGVALTRYMENMLFDLTPLDPMVFGAVPLLFATVVAGAAFLSARPALTLAPMSALRRE
ncbi:MAG: ABC transporter permease [Vicinamibacteraceae bacterium]